jgi:hypothetical protein
MDERTRQQVESFKAELVSSLGVDFDGNAWICMAPEVMFSLDAAVPPKQETLFVAAVNPLSVKITEKLPTGTQLGLIETEFGYVLRLTITLFDDPANPFEMRLPLNPVPEPGAGPYLLQLAEQDWLRIVFFDAIDGSFVTVRNLPMDVEFRASLREIVRLAALQPTTPERWLRAVEQASPYL